jgi:hypothetical protein
MTNSTLAFAVDGEVRVNFGIFAGRDATPAEIDRLAEWLLDEVGEVTIVSEERHEIDAHGEAVIHQVRIAVEQNDPETTRRIVERAEHWAKVCAAERHAEITDDAF